MKADGNPESYRLPGTFTTNQIEAFAGSSMRFLVQTDELEFRDEFCRRFPNSFFFETLPPIPRNPGSVIRPPASNPIGFAIELLAAFRCLARTAHLITGSGNVDMWTILFRGHADNVHQFQG
jgi:hypothetical protein